MENEPEMTSASYAIPADWKARIERAAKEQDRNASQVVRQICVNISTGLIRPKSPPHRRLTPMSVNIPLTQGKVAVIDDADLPLVRGHKWHARRHDEANCTIWYAVTTVKGTDGKRYSIKCIACCWKPELVKSLTTKMATD